MLAICLAGSEIGRYLWPEKLSTVSLACGRCDLLLDCTYCQSSAVGPCHTDEVCKKCLPARLVTISDQAFRSVTARFGVPPCQTPYSKCSACSLTSLLCAEWHTNAGRVWNKIVAPDSITALCWLQQMVVDTDRGQHMLIHLNISTPMLPCGRECPAAEAAKHAQ